MNDSRDSSIRHINVASLAISHLKQIIDKMDNFKEEDLQKLDNALATYMTKRRECTAEKLRRLPIEDTLLDQINSELLHTEKQNEFALKQLEIITKKFELQRQKILNTNQLSIKHQLKEDYEVGSLGNLCKQLILDLSQHKNISEYCVLMKDGLRDSCPEQVDQLVLSINDYIRSMDRIIGCDGSEDSIYDYHSSF